MRPIITLLYFISFLVVSNTAIGLNTSITKEENGQWKLNYTAEQAVSRIAFASNPDNSRIKRWQPTNKEFEIILLRDKEYIVRKDRDVFKQVEFILTPTYTVLPKDYAPFSPFSNGGVAFYTGRFFACPNLCDDTNSTWQFSLKIPNGEHLILDGKLYKNQMTWIDTSGKSIYVGHQKPLEAQEFIAVIDEGLPVAIKNSLNQDIPKMMRLLETKLGGLVSTNKPTLFASYANVNDKYAQGGVLKNQIFIHWNNDTLEQSLKENKNFIKETLWFFAHEAGHLYQKGKVDLLANDVNQSWLHEGHADILAADVLQTLYPESKDYVNSRLQQMKQDCLSQLTSFSLTTAAVNGQFRAHYNCGVLIYSKIGEAIAEKGNEEESEYLVWNTYKRSVEGGAEPGKETFFNVVERLTTKDLSDKIRQITREKNPTIDF